MHRTTVIHINEAPRQWSQNDAYRYIGRAVDGRDGYFANPFLLTNPKEDTERAIGIEAYRQYFTYKMKTDTLFRGRVEQLQGKILVCYCKPKACHGDILVEYLNGQAEFAHWTAQHGERMVRQEPKPWPSEVREAEFQRAREVFRRDVAFVQSLQELMEVYKGMRPYMT